MIWFRTTSNGQSSQPSHWQAAKCGKKTYGETMERKCVSCKLGLEILSAGSQGLLKFHHVQALKCKALIGHQKPLTAAQPKLGRWCNAWGAACHDIGPGQRLRPQRKFDDE